MPQMKLDTSEKVQEHCHYLLGFTDAPSVGFAQWLDLRTTKADLEKAIPASYLPCGIKKYKATKSDWRKALMLVPALERRQLLKANPNVAPLFPRDLKSLGIDRDRAQGCGTRSFNPGRRTVFDVYSAYEILKMMSRKFAPNNEKSTNRRNGK